MFTSLLSSRVGHHSHLCILLFDHQYRFQRRRSSHQHHPPESRKCHGCCIISFLCSFLGLGLPPNEEIPGSYAYYHHLWYHLNTFLLNQSLCYWYSCCILFISFFMCRSISPLSSLILLAWVWPCACPSLSLSAVVRSIRALSRHLLFFLAHCYRDTLLALEFLVMVLAPSLPPPPTLLFRTLEGMNFCFASILTSFYRYLPFYLATFFSTCGVITSIILYIVVKKVCSPLLWSVFRTKIQSTSLSFQRLKMPLNLQNPSQLLQTNPWLVVKNVS